MRLRRASAGIAFSVGELSADEIEEIFLLQGCIESTLEEPEGNGMMHGFCI